MLAKVILWVLSFIPHVDICREPGVVYLRRYYLLGGPRYGLRKWFPWNAYLHTFYQSDEPVPHNHPWVWAKSLILRGAYLEHRFPGEPPCTSEARTGKACPNHPRVSTYERLCCYTRGRWNHLECNTFHWVDLITPTVWTLFISGPRMQEDHANAWGFYTPQGFIPWGQYKTEKHDH